MTKEELDKFAKTCEDLGYRKAMLDIRIKLHELLDLTEYQGDEDKIITYLDLPEKLSIYMDSKLGGLNE